MTGMGGSGAPEPADGRRSRGSAGVLAAAVALVLVFVAVRLSGSPPPPSSRAQVGPEISAVPSPARTTLFDLAPRGSLAEDPAWLSATAALDTLASLPADRHVAFAGDASEERIALVLGRDGGLTVAQWMTGPVGARPDQMAPVAPPSTVSGSGPIALWDVPERHWTWGLLVVVAHPDDAVIFLLGRSVQSDGQESPARTTLPAVGGIALAPVGPPVAVPRGSPGPGWVVAVQGGIEMSAAPVLSTAAQQVAAAPVPTADPRGLRGSVDETQAQDLLHEMVGTYGLQPSMISPTLLTAGPIGDAGDRAILVGATLPTGATVVWLGVAGTGPGQTIRVVATVPAAAGTALGDRVLALPAGWAVSRLPLPPGDGPPGWLVISGPRTGTAAEVLDAAGATLTTVPLDDGAGVAPVPPGTAAIRVLDAAGGDLGRAPIAELTR